MSAAGGAIPGRAEASRPFAFGELPRLAVKGSPFSQHHQILCLFASSSGKPESIRQSLVGSRKPSFLQRAAGASVERGEDTAVFNSLEAYVREGARRMLAAALKEEGTGFLSRGPYAGGF
jgi:hypothetical protein